MKVAELKDLSIWDFPQIRGYLIGDPHNKGYSILGSILGYPNLGKLSYTLLYCGFFPIPYLPSSHLLSPLRQGACQSCELVTRELLKPTVR